MAFHYWSCANYFSRSLKLYHVTWSVSGCNSDEWHWSKIITLLYSRPETAGRWLTKDEKAVAIMRTESSGNTDDKPFDKHQFISALIDYKNWLAGMWRIQRLARVLWYNYYLLSDDLCWTECRTCQLCCFCADYYSWSRFQCTERPTTFDPAICRILRSCICKYITHDCTSIMANSYWNSWYLGIRIALCSVDITLWQCRVWQSLDTYSFWQLLMLEYVMLVLFW